jgi:hypothetical protein
MQLKLDSFKPEELDAGVKFDIKMGQTTDPRDSRKCPCNIGNRCTEIRTAPSLNKRFNALISTLNSARNLP